MLLDPWDQYLPDLLVEKFALFLHQGLDCVLDLLLDDLRKGGLDGLRYGLLNLDLQVLLRLDLLLQTVHLHVQLGEFLVQFLVVLNDLILLLLFGLGHLDGDGGLLLLLLFDFLFALLL